MRYKEGKWVKGEEGKGKKQEQAIRFTVLFLFPVYPFPLMISRSAFSSWLRGSRGVLRVLEERIF